MRAVRGATQRKVVKAPPRDRGASMLAGLPAGMVRLSTLAAAAVAARGGEVLGSTSAINLQHGCCFHYFFRLLFAAEQLGEDVSELVAGETAEELAAVGDADIAGLFGDDQDDGVRFLAHADG